MSSTIFVSATKLLEWHIYIKGKIWNLSYFSPFFFHLVKSICSQNFAWMSFRGLYKYNLFLFSFSSFVVPFPIWYLLQLVFTKLTIMPYNCWYIWRAYCVPGCVKYFTLTISFNSTAALVMLHLLLLHSLHDGMSIK